jgi:hypothetical protein
MNAMMSTLFVDATRAQAERRRQMQAARAGRRRVRLAERRSAR